MKEKYGVDLSDSQRELLKDCVEKGQTTVYKIWHAHILLKADVGWTDAQIAEVFECHP